MLIEFLDKPILIDGNPVAVNLRINLANKHQLRAKLTYLEKDKEYPIDIVVYNYSTPRLDKLSSLSISIDGKEILLNKQFNVQLSFNFIKWKWMLSGKIGLFPVNKELNSLEDIQSVLTLFIKN